MQSHALPSLLISNTEKKKTEGQKNEHSWHKMCKPLSFTHFPLNTCGTDGYSAHQVLVITFFSPPVALRPNAGYDLLILEVSRSHTTTHHNR